VQLVTTAAAALMLGVSKSTLDHYRIRGCGPRFVKQGRLVRYDIAELQRWTHARTVGSTSERFTEDTSAA
jgi:predicted DNA-binding transcriptional regulator AlpA